MDVVYVHKQKDSDEIEYSIRSLINIEHGDIYIIGDDPKLKGLDYIHVPHEKHDWAIQSQFADQISKYLQACEIEALSPDFIAMNDDFFILHEWQPINYNQGLLLNHARNRNIRDGYFQSLKETARYLDSHRLGLNDFELHTPFVFNKDKLKALINSLDNKNLQIRSLYGNIFGVKTEYMTDVKDLRQFRGKTLLSTSKKTWNDEIRAHIRSHI